MRFSGRDHFVLTRCASDDQYEIDVAGALPPVAGGRGPRDDDTVEKPGANRRCSLMKAVNRVRSVFGRRALLVTSATVPDQTRLVRPDPASVPVRRARNPDSERNASLTVSLIAAP